MEKGRMSGDMYKKLDRNDRCWCGSGRKYKSCHEAFDDKVLRYQMEGHMIPDKDMLKSKEQIEGLRRFSLFRFFSTAIPIRFNGILSY